MNRIPPDYIREICMAGKDVQTNLTCRYLNGTTCLRYGEEKRFIDFEVIDFIQEAQANYENPFEMCMPLGDNCEGFCPRSNFGEM